MTLSILSIAVACLLVLVFAFAWPTLPVHLLSRRWPRIIFQGPSTSPFVSLTFDDGPDPTYTPQVLAILRAHGVRATFFVAGERARAYPDILQAICKDGHEIANHSDSWHRTVSLSPSRFEEDLLAAEATLTPSPCYVKIFRPAGIYVRASQIDTLTRRGYRCVLGSTYAFDPHGVPTPVIVWLIRRALRPGAIIVLHDSGGNRTQSVEAVEPVIAHAKALGLRLVRLSQLLHPDRN